MMQAKGAIFVGVPMLFVLVRGSPFEREWRKQEELNS
jgi:hypothetical protein